MNALEHYLNWGARQGRDPHPFFSTRYYMSQNPRLFELSPLEHYLEYGAALGLNPDPRFDTNFYRKSLGDVSENPLLHYVMKGRREGRRTHPDFPAELSAKLIDLTPARA
jgi:hypothetical protein